MSTPHSTLLVPGPRFDADNQPDIFASFFDVDETLVGQHSAELPTEQFLQAAHMAGEKAVLSVVTARSLLKVGHIIEAAGMQGLSILNNGAQVYDGETGQMKVERPLPITATSEILHSLQAMGLDHAVQDDGVDYWWQLEDGVGSYARKRDMHNLFGPDNRVAVPDFLPHKSFFVSVHKVTADQILGLQDLARQYQDQHVSVKPVHEYVADDGGKSYDVFFADGRANKETALYVVSDLAQIELANMMMTGDGLNDRDIVGAVGTGVAMGNAAKATQAVATHITLPWQEDGAAVALKELVLK